VHVAQEVHAPGHGEQRRGAEQQPEGPWPAPQGWSHHLVLVAHAPRPFQHRIDRNSRAIARGRDGCKSPIGRYLGGPRTMWVATAIEVKAKATQFD
jgi:hypothetical protein